MRTLYTSLALASCLAIAPVSIADDSTVAVYDIEGMVPESGEVQANPFSVLSNPLRPITHYDIVQSLNYAAYDDNVQAIILEIDGAGMSLAQLQEIRRLLLIAREEKKDVWLYTEYFNISTALLGRAANHFTLLPEGSVSFSGLNAESMYFKGMLDKVGIEMEVVHIGDFKSAGEQFSRTSPSKPAQKQTDELMDSLFDQIVSNIAEGRNVKQNLPT